MTTTPGRLLLIPNTLDLGAEPVPLDEVLPRGVMRQAAALRHWVAEDARSARALLKRVSAIEPLVAPLQELHIEELPRPRKGSGEPVPPAAWQALLQPALQGQDIGLVSEAGLPAVADPGAELVAAAHAAGITVLPLAGASSLLLALAASGLGGQSFSFVGYLPQESAARARRIRELEAMSRKLGQTQIAIETPYRNAGLQSALIDSLMPSTTLAICSGLTSSDARTRSATISAWRNSGPHAAARDPTVFLWRAS